MARSALQSLVMRQESLYSVSLFNATRGCKATLYKATRVLSSWTLLVTTLRGNAFPADENHDTNVLLLLG